jgi:hypothetical protein
MWNHYRYLLYAPPYPSQLLLFAIPLYLVGFACLPQHVDRVTFSIHRCRLHSQRQNHVPPNLDLTSCVSPRSMLLLLPCPP